MIAFKFLRNGVAPFTAFAWPVGEWLDAGALEPCRSGVHACRARDLPYWLGPELWEIELEGEVEEHERKLVARRGRLVRRRSEWTTTLLDAFVDDVLRRTRQRVGFVPVLSGYVADVERFRAGRRFGLAAFAAARAAELSEGRSGYERERMRQASWLVDRLGIERT